MTTDNSTLLDARALDRTLRRMADEIVELNNGTDDLVIVGIQRRGVQLAARIVSHDPRAREASTCRSGALDITLYRDDLQTVGPRPVVGPTDIPVDIDGKHVVIVDDVLYTGRTIRAALDELADFGRPARIALAVLIDRGGRELPIQPDIVGKTISIGADAARRRAGRGARRQATRVDHRRPRSASDVTLALGKDLLGLEPLTRRADPSRFSTPPSRSRRSASARSRRCRRCAARRSSTCSSRRRRARASRSSSPRSGSRPTR